MALHSHSRRASRTRFACWSGRFRLHAQSLTTMLEEGSRFRWLAWRATAREAVQQVQQLKPDVVTMDVEMPGMTGLQALQQIMTKIPSRLSW